MKAKDFLAGLLEQKQRIVRMAEELEALRSAAVEVGTVPTRHTRHEMISNRQEDAAVIVMDLEKRIAEETDRYYRLWVELFRVIRRIGDPTLECLLVCWHMDGKTCQETAEIMQYSVGYVRKLHRRAMERVQEILDSREGGAA